MNIGKSRRKKFYVYGGGGNVADVAMVGFSNFLEHRAAKYQ